MLACLLTNEMQHMNTKAAKAKFCKKDTSLASDMRELEGMANAAENVGDKETLKRNALM